MRPVPPARIVDQTRAPLSERPMSMRTLRSAACLTFTLTLLFASGAAFAQSAPATTASPEAPTTGTAPATTTAPEAPATGAAPATTSVEPAPVETPVGPPAVPPKIQMNFKDQPLDVILNDLSERLGLAVVKQSSMADVRVTVIARQPLGVEDIIAVLNSALNVKGYAAVRSGPTGRVLKIVTLEDAKKLNVPVHRGARPDLIPTTDEVITQVMSLRYVDATRLRQDLTPLISASASITSNAAGNALIVTDTSANVHRIAEIVWALDNNMAAATEVRVYQLKYADATSAAKLITDIFKPDTTTGGPGGGPGFMRNLPRFVAQAMGGAGPGGAPGAADQGAAFQPPNVKASADTRTNSVVVTGPAEALVVIDGIIKSLESNTVEPQGVFVCALKNGTAANMAPVLNNIFGTSTSTTSIGTRSTTPGTTPGSATSSSLATATGLYGQVYVVANPDTNALMVMTMPKYFEQVKAIIETLDRPIPQVLIRVLIAEITHDDTVDLGAEFSLLNLTSAASGSFGGRLSTNIAELPNPAAGGLIYTALQKDFSATIRALQTIGKLNVLSRPYILASDNQKANFQDIVSYPFAEGSRADVNGNVNTSVTRQSLGISINVTPHINPEGTVTMLINPEIDSLTGQVVQIVAPTPATSTIAANPGLSEQVWGKRLATTQVAVRNGQTIVIGGMIQDKKTDTINKVPFLGDIPVIGKWLFTHTVTGKTKTEVLIFLTPMVAMTPEALKALSKVEEQSAGKDLYDAVEPGTFQKHLDAMRAQVPQTQAPETTMPQTQSPQTQDK